MVSGGACTPQLSGAAQYSSVAHAEPSMVSRGACTPQLSGAAQYSSVAHAEQSMRSRARTSARISTHGLDTAAQRCVSPVQLSAGAARLDAESRPEVGSDKHARVGQSSPALCVTSAAQCRRHAPGRGIKPRGRLVKDKHGRVGQQLQRLPKHAQNPSDTYDRTHERTDARQHTRRRR